MVWLETERNLIEGSRFWVYFKTMARYFKHYELHEKVQYHYLALQTVLLRTSGRSTTLLLRNAVDTVTLAVHCS